MKKEKNINQNPCHALLLESKKLHKYDNCWRIESETKKRIIDHLFCYSKECRNGYFHKENLTYWGDVEKIRDKDIYSLSIEERKYMYYRLDVLRNTKRMEECQDIMGREFHRFGIPPLTAAFVAKWYSSKVSVSNIELQLRLDDVFGD